MVEETMRVPLLVNGPGIPPGATNSSLTTNMDLPVTVLDACNVVSDTKFHGKSLLRTIKESGHVHRDGLMTQHYGLHQHVIQRAYYSGQWKYVIQDDGFEEPIESGVLEQHYGVSVSAPVGLVDDPTGDRLDALLCAIQASRAWTKRDTKFGEPDHTDPLEGWIADPMP